jgi:hypothetical protein
MVNVTEVSTVIVPAWLGAANAKLARTATAKMSDLPFIVPPLGVNSSENFETLALATTQLGDFQLGNTGVYYVNAASGSFMEPPGSIGQQDARACAQATRLSEIKPTPTFGIGLQSLSGSRQKAITQV